MPTVHRRRFIALSAASLSLIALPQDLLDEIFPGAQPPPATYGRVITWWQAVRKLPAPDAEAVSWKQKDDVINLYAEVPGEPPWPTNPVWYLTTGGYIHSGYVQPVEDTPQSEVIREVEPPGFWAEVTVPFAEARWHPTSAYVAHKLYYGTVYRVVRAVEDGDGDWWYQLHQGIAWSPGPYIPSWSVRRILPDELTPIRPGVPDKWIQITLDDQRLRCFEGERLVFRTRIGSGTWRTPTPRGEFRVVIQRHTRRMRGNIGGDRWDLPGVPYPVYFTYGGMAIHGTYWHNDYGRRHSRGCVNLPNPAAKYIFRWVEPSVPYSDYTLLSGADEGTRVVVV